MSLTDPTEPTGQEPAPPPEQNPWQRLIDAGIDPNDPHLLDRLQWGADIMDHSRRGQAIEYLMEQDPAVKAALEQKFAPQAPASEPVNPWTQTEAIDAGFEPTPGPDPEQMREYIRQEAQTVAQTQLDAFRQEQQHQRLQDHIDRQVQALAATENLSAGQQQEVWNRAWMNVTSGEVDEQAFPTVAQAALEEIRGVWAPPPPVADPVVEAGQRYAQRPSAPMVAAGAGPAPSGDPALNSIEDSAAAARRLIAENKAQGGWG